MVQAGLVREAMRGPTTAGQVVALPLPPSAPPQQRLLSLDFLRGFTMFWIVGGREFVLGIVAYYNPPLTDAVETQLTHATWKGFVAWDMVMPVFLFLVGAAMPLALAKRVEPGQSLKSAYWRIARRVAVLWILGMFTQWMKYRLHLPELYSNTLQAIAVGYLVTSLALLHLRLPGQLLVLAALLVGYWALLVFVPFGGYSAGTLERTANFARYVDEKVLDVFRRDHSFTWVVTSLGFSASVLLGAMAGHLLRARLSVSRRLAYLLLAGFGCMAGGWVWSYSHPLNRHLWTSSMVLWAGGWSFLLLALSHTVIDVWGVRRWTYPFIVIGANALLAYVLDSVFDWRLGKLLAWVFPAQLPTISADLLTSTCELALLWLILWWLYRHRLFLRA